MKKILTTTKAMLLTAVILVMAQSCIPTVPGGVNPTVDLTGKIKSATISGGGQITVDKYFTYDTTNGKLKEINTIYDGGVYSSKQIISYQTNKVILYDYINQTNYVNAILYLQNGTNFVDSIDAYYNYNLAFRTIFQRDIQNRLSKISIFIIQQVGLVYFVPYAIVDSFEYNSNNLISFKETRNPALNLNLEFTRKYQMEYDLSKAQKPNTDFTTSKEIVLFGLYATSGFTLSIDILGVSVGNTSTNVISNVLMSEFAYNMHRSEFTSYSYSPFSSTDIGISWQGPYSGNQGSVYNTYY